MMMMLMVQNDGHSSAIKDYDEVIRIDPTLAKAYNNRGYCHQNLNNHEQGTGTCYEWYRGECHWHRWRIVTDVVQLATSIHPSSAIKDFNRALELVSDINRTERIDALYNRAFSYSRLNKHEQGAVHCAFPPFKAAARTHSLTGTVFAHSISHRRPFRAAERQSDRRLCSTMSWLCIAATQQTRGSHARL